MTIHELVRRLTAIADEAMQFEETRPVAAILLSLLTAIRTGDVVRLMQRIGRER